MHDPAYQLLMEYALRALSQRAHTISQMREKLKKKPHHTEKVENEIIARLEELNLLNDKEYVRRSVESAVNFRYEGCFKLAQRNYLKGIPLELTKKIWFEMGVDEADVAKRALAKLEKKVSRVSPEKRKQKRMQFLSARGFTPDIIYDLVSNHN